MTSPVVVAKFIEDAVLNNDQLSLLDVACMKQARDYFEELLNEKNWNIAVHSVDNPALPIQTVTIRLGTLLIRNMESLDEIIPFLEKVWKVDVDNVRANFLCELAIRMSYMIFIYYWDDTSSSTDADSTSDDADLPMYKSISLTKSQSVFLVDILPALKIDNQTVCSRALCKEMWDYGDSMLSRVAQNGFIAVQRTCFYIRSRPQQLSFGYNVEEIDKCIADGKKASKEFCAHPPTGEFDKEVRLLYSIIPKK